MDKTVRVASVRKRDIEYMEKQRLTIFQLVADSLEANSLRRYAAQKSLAPAIREGYLRADAALRLEATLRLLGHQQG